MKTVAFRARLRRGRPLASPSLAPSLSSYAASTLRLSSLFSRACLGLAFVVCAACQSQSSSSPETQTQTSELEQQANTSTAGGKGAEEAQIPTVEDYEEEVAQAITEKSDLGKELDALEQEIGE